MQDNTREAIRLLKAYTAGSCDIWQLAGPSKASCRAHIMSALAGHRVPQAKAGVNALRDRFYSIANPAGNCPAMREEAFTQWAKEA